jgi:protein phosphatase PTC7
VLIAATDGVLDNLFDRDLQACVSELLSSLSCDDPFTAQDSISLLARNIAERASAIGQRQNDPGVSTPFMRAAAEEGRDRSSGGKLDDIAIVCGVVREGLRPGLRLGHNFNGPPQLSRVHALCHA